MMKRSCLKVVLVLIVWGCGHGYALAQDSAEMQPVDHPLKFMLGQWKGPATGRSPTGEPYQIVQTEEIKPMLDGGIVVVEGRGYSDSGDLKFNAFAIISQTGKDSTWEIRSYAHGRAGTFPIEIHDNGFVWSTPAGPKAIVRYTATITEDQFHEIGEYLAENSEPVQIFEMTLQRVGDAE